MTDTLEQSTAEDTAPTGSSLRTVLVSVIGVAVLVVAVGLGYVWGHSGASSSTSVPKVDAGFARDMATHHQQAITMAAYTRDNTTDPAIKAVAFDIESSQSIEMGEMEGWLLQWNVSRTSGTPMDWMSGHHHVSANGLMPGMATPAEMTKLQTLHGKALSIMFLQLMIRHHQGGLEMAQYAMDHATEPYVRQLAATMYTNQSAEIITMERELRQLGAAPLAPPQD